MKIEVNSKSHTLQVNQELTFFNQTKDALQTIILNDWNNAYSATTTPLAKRFSDEFIRSFHLAPESDRGNTSIIAITNQDQSAIAWSRPLEQPDLIELQLQKSIQPGEKIIIQLSYIIKLPNDRFTSYGFGNNGKMTLRNSFIVPARYDENGFLRYSNNDLDDNANATTDYDITINFDQNLFLQTDLDIVKYETTIPFKTYHLKGGNRSDFSIYLNSTNEFQSFKNNTVEIITDLKSNGIDDIQKALLIDKIVVFVNENIGPYPHEKIVVSQVDYDRNPFYGLNQLPRFISPFDNSFLFEIKFLKSYINTFLQGSLKLNPRKDNWIYDGIQIYFMMQYIEQNHPNSKMMGALAKFKLLKSFNLVNLNFNQQYTYFYMLMARKNLDQPLAAGKNTLIRFNDKIANKYRAGLSFKYLDHYLENGIVDKSIRQFYTLNLKQQTNRTDFEKILQINAGKNIDWFFNTIINSRAIIDYKFTEASKTKDSITYTIKNRTNTNVPIPVYSLRDKEIVTKQWLENVATDTTVTIPRNGANKIVINYKNEVPEFNLRNNWRKFSGFTPNNRPFKFVLMKDLEDPYYNQILYVPSFSYNLYDGVSPGIRLHNKTILDKPFTFDINPAYSTNTKSLIGSFGLGINNYNRESNLYNIQYYVSGSYFHYAPNAAYLSLKPSISLRLRNADFRNNRKEGFIFREVVVSREKSPLLTNPVTQNYAVFNTRYYNTKTEITNHVSFNADMQLSKNFGKLSGEISYRQLFQNNRQVNLRLYAGSFVYNNTNSDFFSFALDRPTDYLFDYNYLGRSESSGIFSQQIILAEGGFKSKLDTPFANQWMTTLNGSFNIWNWIEVYGDIGLLKNKTRTGKLVYDSGIRLNLVTDYFELYFPVYSNNGWEIAQKNYNEKIRFIITLSPRALTGLFTRKWF